MCNKIFFEGFGTLWLTVFYQNSLEVCVFISLENKTLKIFSSLDYISLISLDCFKVPGS